MNLLAALAGAVPGIGVPVVAKRLPPFERRVNNSHDIRSSLELSAHFTSQNTATEQPANLLFARVLSGKASPSCSRTAFHAVRIEVRVCYFFHRLSTTYSATHLF
jgi:hypothetical protein